MNLKIYKHISVFLRYIVAEINCNIMIFFYLYCALLVLVFNIILVSYNNNVFLQKKLSGELSSISGSDTEDDEDLDPVSKPILDHNEESSKNEERSIFNLHPSKKFYVTRDLKLVSFYRGVLNEV